MSSYKYAFEDFEEERMARCIGKDLSISTKHSIEICRFLRRKNLQKAKDILMKVVKKEEALKYTRFNKGVGHKPGIGPGRYPVKACKEFHKLLESVENNAVFKGLDANNLIIVHSACHRASRPMRYSRRTRGEAKRTHVEIIVEEKIKEKKKEIKKEPKKEDKKESSPQKKAIKEDKK